MAFDPIREDCLRLILSGMRKEHIMPLENMDYIARASLAYQRDPAELINTDQDRSFHLVVRATELLDYQAPFLVDESEIDQCIQEATGYLREAIELDKDNWDARRMLATVESDSEDELIAFLEDNLVHVEAHLSGLIDEMDDPYTAEFVQDVGRHPYQRWLATLASRLLIAGRYHKALEVVERSLEVMPYDPADIRHTGVLTLAKLEATQEEFDQFLQRHALAYQQAAADAAESTGSSKEQSDAWTLIARMCLAYRSFDLELADTLLKQILDTYKQSAQSLYYQPEFPEGVFSRVCVKPYSSDELVLALSEATPLLQEGLGTPDNASFAAWLARHKLVHEAIAVQNPSLFERIADHGTEESN